MVLVMCHSFHLMRQYNVTNVAAAFVVKKKPVTIYRVQLDKTHTLLPSTIFLTGYVL